MTEFIAETRTAPAATFFAILAKGWYVEVYKSIVASIAAGIGYVWAANVIKWGAHDE